MYDVIIAGAGPGGASAAYFLGEAGQRALVLEKATLPRYKTCCGGLSTRMLEKYFPSNNGMNPTCSLLRSSQAGYAHR